MPRVKKTREERASETRESLLWAACEVVGDHGYAGASISRITDKAGVAQGTFYLYFSSQQELFDSLLPYIGTKALDHLREVTRGYVDFFEREERAFRAFFEYLLDNPFYYRVLGEAETAAPQAFETWFEYITNRYVRNLERAADAGEVIGLSKQELRFMAVILLGCRRYVYQQFAKTPAGPTRLPEWVVDAYMKLIRRSLGDCVGLGGGTGDATDELAPPAAG